MTNQKKFAGDVNVYSGSTFEVALEAQTGSTGYSWVLAHMPDSINLIDIRHETAHSSICGSRSQQVFVFAAIETDQSYIAFNLIRPWIPGEIACTKTFALIIVEKPKNLEQDLEDILGSCKFAATKADQSNAFPGIALYMAPIKPLGYHQAIPYGVPLGVVEDPEKCLLAYGTPHGVATDPAACVLKYGFPLHMMEDPENCTLKYGCPVVKYGFPVVKYGFPMSKDSSLQVEAREENCLLKYGCPVEMVDDPDNCVVKYGTPNEPVSDNCLLKYGCPVEVKEDADNCVIKYGIPTGVASDMANCTVKYGFPISAVEDASQCIVKYGAPSEQKE